MMHNIPALLAPALALALTFTPYGARGQESVPVHLEPRHRLVLDSARFRVLDVQITPGDTTLFHVHSTAIMYITISVSGINSQPMGLSWPATQPSSNPRGTPGAVRIDSSYIARPLTHRVTNVGSSLFRLIAITVVAPALPGSQALTLPGTREISSTWYEQARVRLEAQTATSWMDATTPVLIVQPVSGALRVESDGREPALLESAGRWLLLPAGARYRLLNSGNGESNAVVVAIR